MADSEADAKRYGALDDDLSGANIDYRCKKCDSIVPRGTHHRMTSCTCGAVQVDRGWYGSRVLWKGGNREDVVEEIVRG